MNFKPFSSPFFTKLFNWEYWPMYITNIPTVAFWLYFAVRSRKLFFFSAANPVMETGGMLGASKFDILQRIPVNIIPKTILIKKEEKQLDNILVAIKNAEITFPLIAKPDVGERGFLVEKVNNQQELKSYLSKINVAFIIQELVDYPLEVGVFYHRMPDADSGKITSVCVKAMLTVTGDGKKTIGELMAEYPRANLQLPRFQKQYPVLLQEVLPTGEQRLLEPIGNHSRGTTFLNGNHHIDAQLEAVFDKISHQMPDIYYGRFDMKCMSIEDLKAGKNIKVLEFNGTASEPAHIYDPAYPLFKSYQDIYQHWKILYQICKKQAARGVKAMTLKQTIKSVRFYRQQLRNA